MTNEEQRLYAIIGRQHMQLEEQQAAADVLLDLLAKVVSGEIDRSRVLVNLTEKRAIWAPIGQRPGLPATVNGLPHCVVAPEEMVTGDGPRALSPQEIAELMDGLRDEKHTAAAANGAACGAD